MRLSFVNPRNCLPRALALSGLMFVLAGCSTKLQTSHDPMHAISESVALTVSATGLIDRIEIRIKRSVINPNDGSETEEWPLFLAFLCDPPSYVTELTCIYEAPWSGHGKMMEFEGSAILWDGSVVTESYRFANGAFPLVGTPIPIRVNLDPLQALDVVIIPDPDLINDIYQYPWTEFRKYLDDLVDGIFFEYAAIRRWRGLYNFYYAPDTGQFDEANCDFSYGQDIDDIDALNVVADTLMYVHSKEKWDCTKGTDFSTEIWYDKSAVHELGHALIGLRDEYYKTSVGDYGPQATMGNTFQGKAACVTEAPDIELPASYCAIASYPDDVWRIDPTGATGCIMGASQHKAGSDFGPACNRRIYWRYEKCLDGDCMSLADLEGL